ncbi:heme NO-binding domain-containing protein [Acetobacter estunensis]|uniref:heme NO-binding domain-containing protein n=1 Tax=Acetobacter estunensis TaxID=104097 RepID=UPI001C2D0322|nr:heme NO-binding domain-containing protein [Acetobacter estunensis]MBV1837142.1 heme NO-binding domain-containing protein [Acetobacter estunensis]
MKGIVFNLLEDVVSEQFGIETWDLLLEDAKVDGVYSSLGNYPDADMLALVKAASQRLKLPEGEVLRWFGEKAMPLLKQTYPELFEQFPTARTFILSVNTIIHPEVMKLYSGACCPYFHFTEQPDGALEMRYQSSRHLLDLAHGFILGAADIWHENISVERYPSGSPKENDMTIRWQGP